MLSRCITEPESSLYTTWCLCGGFIIYLNEIIKTIETGAKLLEQTIPTFRRRLIASDQPNILIGAEAEETHHQNLSVETSMLNSLSFQSKLHLTELIKLLRLVVTVASKACLLISGTDNLTCSRFQIFGTFLPRINAISFFSTEISDGSKDLSISLIFSASEKKRSRNMVLRKSRFRSSIQSRLCT
jgi:hypothetical protein